MRTLEFRSRVDENRRLTLPPEIAAQVESGETVRVIVVLADRDDAEWLRLTPEQFLAGYAEGDAIYDALPSE